MNKHPFQPIDDTDHLNTTLDAMVTGQRAPETGTASNTDALAATAHLINGQSAKPGEYPSDETLDTIWRNVMQSPSHALPAQTPFTPFSPNGTAFRGEIPNVPPGERATRFGSWFSIAAMIALLVGLIGGAWNSRHPGGDNEPIRLAATVLDATPEGSASNDAWLTYVQPEECTLERKAPSEVTKLQAETDGWPIPTYGPGTSPASTDAESAATAARALTSCFMYRSDGNYSSGPFLWRYTSPNSPLFTPEASVEHQESNGRDVSRDLSDLSPADLLVRTGIQPDQAQEEMPVTFLPDQAIQFPDGRIGIPMAYLIPAGTSYEIPEALYTTLFVVSNESGTWLLDDSLSVCIGECDAYLNGGPWNGNAYIGTSESTEDWLTWVRPEECTVEPMTATEYRDIMREEPDISGRSYDVVGPADSETANAVVTAARAHEACLNFGTYDQVRALESQAFVFYRSVSIDRTLTADDKHQIDLQHGEQISEQMPTRPPSDYAAIHSDEVPEEIRTEIIESNPSLNILFFYAYNPEHAMVLEDGRIAIPAVSLYWDENPWIVSPTQDQIDSSTRPAGFMLILTDESGQWKLDEQLLFCSGVDCDDFWTEHTGTPMAAATITSDWLTWVRPEECTVEPMTTGEFDDMVREEPDISGRSYDVVGPADPETAEAAATAARTREACLTFGSRDQARVFQSPAFVYYRIATVNGSIRANDIIQRDNEHGQQLSQQMPVMTPADYVAIVQEEPSEEILTAWQTDTNREDGPIYAPAYNPDHAMLLADGRVAIPTTVLYWAGDPNAPTMEEVNAETQTVRAMLIMTNISGNWKLDEQLYLCQGADCDSSFWGENMGTPLASPEA